MITDWLGIAARVFLGLVLIAAAWTKLRSPRWSLKAIADGVPRPVVLGLPAAESLLGLALIGQVMPKVFSWVAVVLFGSFLVFVISRYGDPRGCNCSGDKVGIVGAATVARNVAYLFVAVIGTVF